MGHLLLLRPPVIHIVAPGWPARIHPIAWIGRGQLVAQDQTFYVVLRCVSASHHRQPAVWLLLPVASSGGRVIATGSSVLASSLGAAIDLA
jgi:hypothetical protein